MAAATLLLAACGTGLEYSGEPGTAGSMRVANLIGPPEEASTRVLTAIGTKAASEGLDIAIQGDGATEFSIAGYLTAVGEASSTDIAYVWDVANAANERVHRITGTLKAKSASDPWQAIDTETANAIAEIVVADLKAWRAKTVPAPAATPATDSPEADAPAEPAALVATATSAPPQAERSSTSAPPLVSLTAANRERQPFARNARRGNSIALVDISGVTEPNERALANGLRKSLAARGLVVTSDPARAGYRLVAEISSAPPEGGQQAVAIIWTLADRRGSQLGTVRQVNKLPPSRAKADWPAAAEAASNGIVDLVLANPVQ